jgi:hypothetical protein
LLAKNASAIFILLLITLVFGAQVSAEPGFIVYNKRFDVNGMIQMKAQYGSEDNAGQHKTLISGVGSLSRLEEVMMTPGYLDIKNASEWTADPDSPVGLQVASSFMPYKDLENEAEEESNQVFAVSVKANPGESGRLDQAVSAAYYVYEDEEVERYFYIEQFASTSDGTMKRYIDLVDPETGHYLYEDTIIRGYATVTDALVKLGENNLGVSRLIESYSAEDELLEIEALILNGGELFEQTVPLGTELSEVTFPELIELESEKFALTDLALTWNELSEPEYNAYEAGTYIFKGELVLTDQIRNDQNVYIFFYLTVDPGSSPESGELEDQ